MQIACFYLLLMPMQSANLQAIKAVGRSDLYLKLEIIKRASGILILVVTMRLGVLAIAWGTVLTTLIAGVLNAVPTKKLLGYTYLQQIGDMLPSLILSVFACVPVYFVQYLHLHDALTLLLQVGIAAGLYLGLSILTKNENFKYLLSTLKGRAKKN